MSERVEPRKGFVVGAEALIIVEGSKRAFVLARVLSSHRGRSRRHVTEDLPRNLSMLQLELVSLSTEERDAGNPRVRFREGERGQIPSPYSNTNDAGGLSGLAEKLFLGFPLPIWV
jgi:hypothetical protein